MNNIFKIKMPFILALLMEVVLFSFWVLLTISEGHSGLTAGGILQFPGAIFGVIALEMLRDMEWYFPIITCFIVTFIAQLIILTLLIRLILKFKNRSKPQRLNLK